MGQESRPFVPLEPTHQYITQVRANSAQPPSSLTSAPAVERLREQRQFLGPLETIWTSEALWRGKIKRNKGQFTGRVSSAFLDGKLNRSLMRSEDERSFSEVN